MHSPERRVLLLEGPGYYNEKKPLTSNVSALFEDVDPLGIRIVSRFLQDAGVERVLMKMHPGRIGELEDYISDVSGVFISSRFFDTEMAKQVIQIANKRKVPVVSGGYGPTYNETEFAGATRVLSESEWVLPQVVGDFLAGHLQPEYNAQNLKPFDVTNHYVWPDRSLPSGNQLFSTISRHRRVSMEWLRGCWGYCTYCSVTRMQRGGTAQGRGVRVRNIGDIMAEGDSMNLKPGDFLFLADNNTALIPRTELLVLLNWVKQHKLRFVTEATVAPLLKDLETYGSEVVF